MTNNKFNMLEKHLDDMTNKAFALSNMLKTLFVALPEDLADCAFPTKSLVGNLSDMAEQLAEELFDPSVEIMNAIKKAA